MNNQAEVTLPWGDGTYCFRLTVKGTIELEQKCDAPFGEIFNRIRAGKWKVSDIIETIRLGLVGGGTSSADAVKLVERYWHPLADNVPTALLVLSAIMFGFEESPLGKDQAASEQSQSESTPPESTPASKTSGTRPMSLEEFHSGNWLQ